MTTFENALNGHRVEVGTFGPFIWTLIFGALYFLLKGSIKHFLLSIILAVFTVGISWLIYPFFAPGILRNMYLVKVIGRSIELSPNMRLKLTGGPQRASSSLG